MLNLFFSLLFACAICATLCKFFCCIPFFKKRWFMAHVQYPSKRNSINSHLVWVLDRVFLYDSEKADNLKKTLVNDFSLQKAVYYRVDSSLPQFERPTTFAEARLLLQQSTAFDCTANLQAVLSAHNGPIDANDIFSCGFFLFSYYKKISNTQVIMARKLMFFPENFPQILPYTASKSRRPIGDASVDDNDITVILNQHEQNDNMCLAAAILHPDGHAFDLDYL